MSDRGEVPVLAALVGRSPSSREGGEVARLSGPGWARSMRKLHLLSELLLKHPLIVLPLLLCHLQCEPTLTPETLQNAQSRVPTSLNGQKPTPRDQWLNQRAATSKT
jgi:hypothetical protein